MSVYKATGELNESIMLSFIGYGWQTQRKDRGTKRHVEAHRQRNLEENRGNNRGKINSENAIILSKLEC